jgi:hypothetical protein
MAEKKALEVGSNLIHASNLLHCHILVKHPPKFNDTTNAITGSNLIHWQQSYTWQKNNTLVLAG